MTSSRALTILALGSLGLLAGCGGAASSSGTAAGTATMGATPPAASAPTSAAATAPTKAPPAAKGPCVFDQAAVEAAIGAKLDGPPKEGKGPYGAECRYDASAAHRSLTVGFASVGDYESYRTLMKGAGQPVVDLAGVGDAAWHDSDKPGKHSVFLWARQGSTAVQIQLAISTSDPSWGRDRTLSILVPLTKQALGSG